MPDGLKVIVDADVQKAIAAFKEVTKEAGVTGAAIGALQKQVAFFGGGVNAFTNSFKKLPPALNPIPPALKKVTTNVRQANTALIGLSRIVQDAPFGFIAISNNLTELPAQFRALKAETGSTAAAFKALGGAMLGAGGIGFALSIVTSLLTSYSLSNRGAKKETEELSEEAKAAAAKEKEYADAINSASQALLSQAKNLKDLRTLLISTSGEITQITDATIKQGIASLLFDQKNAEAQKLLNNLIQKRIELAKLKSPFAGVGTFQDQLPTAPVDPRLANAKSLRRINELNKELNNSNFELSKLNSLADALDLGDIFKTLVDGKGKGSNALDDIIARAQELQSEFPSLFPPLYLSALDTLEEKAAKARAALNVFFRDLATGFNRGERGVAAVPVDIQLPTTQDFAQQLSALVKPLRNTPIDFGLGDKARQKELGRIFGIGDESILSRAQKEAVFAAQAIQGVLTPAFNGLFDAIKAGESPLKAFFQSLGQSVAQLIQKLIQAAIQAAILSAIFPGGVNGVKGFGSIFKNILGFAQGGIVSGPTLALIGEGVGTSRSNPEIVAPLDQLRSMLADLGGGGQTVVVMGTLRGDKFRLMQDRTARRQRRTTGR